MQMQKQMLGFQKVRRKITKRGKIGHPEIPERHGPLRILAGGDFLLPQNGHASMPVVRLDRVEQRPHGAFAALEHLEKLPFVMQKQSGNAQSLVLGPSALQQHPHLGPPETRLGRADINEMEEVHWRDYSMIRRAGIFGRLIALNAAAAEKFMPSRIMLRRTLCRRLRLFSGLDSLPFRCPLPVSVDGFICERKTCIFAPAEGQSGSTLNIP